MTATDRQFDPNDPKRNMFGVKDCPRCGSRYRWPTRVEHPKHPAMIVCDDCGAIEPYDPAKKLEEERS